MKFAFVNGVRVEPAPRLRGTCGCCGTTTIAKCGKFKIWHWAHKSRLDCDAWWENETQWHRNWKNKFLAEWQEHILLDMATGERHIADVFTPAGTAIEFQHSILHPDELAAREAFYGSVVWIVDGNRSDLDWAHFRLGLTMGAEISGSTVCLGWVGRGKIFERWSIAHCPVYFDFGDGILWKLLNFDVSTKSIRTEIYLKEDLVAHLTSPENTKLEPIFFPVEIIRKLTALHRVS